MIISTHQIKCMENFYDKDIKKLGKLLNKNLDSWLYNKDFK